jgi:RHS repeat-associated protein
MRINDDSSEHLFFLFADQLGSTNVTSDPNGLLVSLSLYMPWGGTRNGGSGTTLTDYAFTGQRKMNDSVGLIYYGARFYDSELGRFAQPDSIVPGLDNSMVPTSPDAWNRYEYVNNNPVKYNDPSGHCPIFIVALIIIGVIVLTGDIPHSGAGDAANVKDLVTAGLQHDEHANIVGEGLQSLQDDPSVKAAQSELVGRITNVPEYRKQAYSNVDVSDSFKADGPSGNWKQAAWEGNQAFWMVRHGDISATNIKVSADGTINTTWHIHDNFNFIPGPDRSKDYNKYATIVHFIYNDVLRAEESFPTDAYWNETITPPPPPEEESTSK